MYARLIGGSSRSRFIAAAGEGGVVGGAVGRGIVVVEGWIGAIAGRAASSLAVRHDCSIAGGTVGIRVGTVSLS